jgi:hypothetical protein
MIRFLFIEGAGEVYQISNLTVDLPEASTSTTLGSKLNTISNLTLNLKLV